MFHKKPKLFLLIEKDMSLSVFLDLIKKCPKGIQLFIEIENNWQFLHSIVSVKQIKEAIENIEVFINTPDSIGIKLLESVNIPSFETLPEDITDFYDELVPDGKKFQINKVGEAFEAQEFEVIKVIRESGEEHLHKVYDTVHELPLKSKILLGLASFVALGLVSFLIALIAPSATITVQAEKKMIQSVVNTNFIKSSIDFHAPKEDKGNNFHLYPIELRFEHQFDFPVISKIFEGQNAEGEITLYNNFNEDITLRNGTKLQTESGLIFLTKYYVRVPAKHLQKNKEGKNVLVPGVARVGVRANDVDLYQEVIGSRGNIEAQKFSIPGLTTYMQKLIWGESEQAMTGGTTRWRIEVQQSDLDAATQKMENTLLSIAREEIVKYIDEQNIQLQKPIALFPLEEYIKTEVSKITIPPNILGSNIQIFPVKGEMLVSAYVFSQDSFYGFLKTHIEQKKDPNMKIETVDFPTMTLRKFNETPTEIRITVDLQGRQSFQVDNRSTNGKQFQKEIKESLTGMNIQEAIKVLNNNQKISKAQIRVWPPIKESLPLIAEKITIVEE